MIAICTRQGAFIYECSETEADRRISNIEHSPAYVKPEFVKDGLDYDNKRREASEWRNIYDRNECSKDFIVSSGRRWQF